MTADDRAMHMRRACALHLHHGRDDLAGVQSVLDELTEDEDGTPRPSRSITQSLVLPNQ